ncbi:DNA primase [Rhodohalobacter sp. SW132]|uniref:DNA primase n=1 Tax=Rhodohalobacter sp. SW132 TaxID=2293433 RepID=UPI000E27CA13|nr:DNA primase [Rhodohalobacter sp. SW132]REL38294.1 DNA primase [Rhodohalobacter sp. SW132]
MTGDDKKEEIREAADIVEVINDYVRLKKSGNGFVGLCPFHDEKTPSFHVTPRMGIYKCFGCGESGDVYNFIMEMEGVSFPDAMKTLADRYGIDLPKPEESEKYKEESHLREGVLHALKYAGLYYHRQLHESSDAKKAREYLNSRGYDDKIIRTFGLGYAPGGGDSLLKEAEKEGIKEEYLAESDLIKPSNRGDGFYDTFRDRLMFPIFNPSGKVIAFAGRILNENKKTAKYVNSAQTIAYNKSEVVYGVNFAKNDIRKEEEVILVEGYTDVITMYQHGIKNVVASSGTSLTSKQINILQRYGNRIVMIYDADEAGQKAMERGLKIALHEGMEVNLLELPDGEDPDSFVKQFGKDSFLNLKKEKAEDFISFTIHKAEKKGDLEKPGDRARLIHTILEQIAEIPEEIQRQVYVQHLHQKTQQYRKGSDRELFQQLEKFIAEKRRAEQRSKRREQSAPVSTPNDPRPAPPQEGAARSKPAPEKKRPFYEKEIIRLLLTFGPKMQKFIGHNVGADQIEDEQLREFYEDIMTRHIKEQEISVEHYSSRDQPFPSLLSDILLERYSVSENHSKATGNEFKKDKFPFKSAKSAMKALRLHFYERKRAELSQLLKEGDTDERQRFMKMISKVQKEITKIQKMSADMLFDDPDFMDDDSSDTIIQETFEYKMKGEK